MEKVYEFRIYDTLIGEVENKSIDWIPIKDISMVLEKYRESRILLDITSPGPKP